LKYQISFSIYFSKKNSLISYKKLIYFHQSDSKKLNKIKKFPEMRLSQLSCVTLLLIHVTKLSSALCKETDHRWPVPPNPDRQTASLSRIMFDPAQPGFTLMFWLKVKSLGGDWSGVLTFEDGTEQLHFGLFRHAAVVFVLLRSNGVTRCCATQRAIGLNRWTHVAVVVAATRQRIDVVFDGVSQALVDISGRGDCLCEDQRTLKADLQHLQVFAAALGADEIRREMKKDGQFRKKRGKGPNGKEECLKRSLKVFR